MPRRPRSGTIRPCHAADGSLRRDAEGLVVFDISYYDAAARHRHTRRAFATQSDAQAWVHEQRESRPQPAHNHLADASKMVPPSDGPTWRDLHQAWENAHRHLSASQIGKVSRTVERLEERLGAGCSFAAATGEEVRAMVRGLVETSGPVAARHALAHLKAVARWARGELLIPEAIPFEHLAAPAHKGKATGAIPLDQIPALLAALGPWVQPIVRWIALTGCRQQDAAGLLLADITPSEAVCRVKGGRRIVYRLDAPLLDCLAMARLQCETAGIQSAYAFPNSAGNRWTDTHLANTVRKAWAPIGPWRLHALRHTFATVAGRLGYGADMIKAGLGHLARATSERYTHTAADDSARAEVGAAVRKAIFGDSTRARASSTRTAHEQHKGTPNQGSGGKITDKSRKIKVSFDGREMLLSARQIKAIREIAGA